MKTRKLFWLIALTVMATIFAACGGDQAAGGDAGGDGDANTNSAIELSQSETIEAPEFGGSISVSYPEGWAIQSEAGAILLANSEEALETGDLGDTEEIPAGTVLASVIMIPGEMAGAMGLTGDVTPTAIIETFSAFMAGDDMPEFGDIEELTIGGNPAARASGSDDKMSAVMYAVDNDGNFTFGFGVTRADEADANADVIQAIIASAEFTAAE